MECARNICAESRGEIAACSRRPLGSLIKGCFRELEIWLGMQKKRERERKKGTIGTSDNTEESQEQAE